MLEFQGENCTFRITLIVITLGLQPEYFPSGLTPECFVSEPLSFLSFTFIDYWDRRINQPRRDHSTIYLHQTSLPVPQVFVGTYGHLTDQDFSGLEDLLFLSFSLVQ